MRRREWGHTGHTILVEQANFPLRLLDNDASPSNRDVRVLPAFGSAVRSGTHSLRFRIPGRPEVPCAGCMGSGEGGVGVGEPDAEYFEGDCDRRVDLGEPFKDDNVLSLGGNVWWWCSGFLEWWLCTCCCCCWLYWRLCEPLERVLLVGVWLPSLLWLSVGISINAASGEKRFYMRFKMRVYVVFGLINQININIYLNLHNSIIRL